jgi:hypothetical protein
MVKDESSSSDSDRLDGSPTREEKLENLITNHSIIFMGMFEEAFSTIMDELTENSSPKGSTPTTAEDDRAWRARDPTHPDGLSTGDGKKAGMGGITPEIRAHITYVLSSVREEMGSQWPKDAALFKRYVSSPDFDKGIEIVERYDFGRPKLTERLSDEMLASYIFLLQSGDKKVEKMFTELSEWQSHLPASPWSQ